MRELRTAGKPIKVDVKIYDKPKYCMDAVKIDTIVYSGLINWEIITGEDAADIEAQMGADIDELHEYIVLNFEDGKTATFKNSYVDLMRW